MFYNIFKSSKNQRSPKCPLLGIDLKCYIHKMKFCTVVKNNEITLTDVEKCPYIVKLQAVMSKHLYETRKCLWKIYKKEELREKESMLYSLM